MSAVSALRKSSAGQTAPRQKQGKGKPELTEEQKQEIKVCLF